ncbi:putative ribosomally synthesized peptide with SipW-like signal peptide [Labedella gwakjiensis]|uniref:Putative ribosomally synthesized peptide with SipW-like signal peptide n=1 Tax=Labedella gwakjiensis TaxID=390269 RepID=A0A2P8GXF3_9MICO|nr:fibronectin type III domain-containing protein [Labedella gwakjiensis]PSL38652.1 putative ribosomally synthesized peptide with SipW-like signal peptide [Labedella gwakjiensis]RUQ86850.1 hypothetical protein ELQ93_07835 [Labedella gwakjiensis]
MNDRHPSRMRSRLAAIGTAAALCSALTLPQTTVTEAAFTDREHAGGMITAGRLAAPTALTCTIESVLGLLANYRIGWTAPSGPTPTGYTITVTYSSGSPVYTGAAPAGATSFVISGGLLEGLLVPGTYSITVRATLQNWTGPVASPAQTGRLVVATGWRCS